MKYDQFLLRAIFNLTCSGPSLEKYEPIRKLLNPSVMINKFVSNDKETLKIFLGCIKINPFSIKVASPYPKVATCCILLLSTYLSSASRFTWPYVGSFVHSLISVNLFPSLPAPRSPSSNLAIHDFHQQPFMIMFYINCINRHIWHIHQWWTF